MLKFQTLKEIRPHGSKAFPCAIYQTQFSTKGSFVKHHWHDEIELIYFFSGDFRLEINMEQFFIRSECLYFINSGELHSIITEKSGSLGEYAVVFNPSILNLDPYDSIQIRLIQPLQDGKLLFPRCLLPEHPAFQSVRDTFMDIINIIKDPFKKDLMIKDGTSIDDLSSQLYIKSSLLHILSILLSHQMLAPIENNYDKRVEDIKAVLTYIKENYKEKIYIRDLSDLINMNEQYFCRFFKKAIGHTPIEFINEYRIRQSMHLLEKTDLAVTEICLECGYNNIGNFLKEFRRYTNTTPLKYRKFHQKSK